MKEGPPCFNMGTLQNFLHFGGHLKNTAFLQKALFIPSQEVEAPVCKSEKVVGIDLGVVRFATLSSEEVIEPLDMEELEDKIRWEQKKIRRKEKFSEKKGEHNKRLSS